MENVTDSNEYAFSDADMKVFEERRKKRLSGESKTYSWDEAKNIITDKNMNNVLVAPRFANFLKVGKSIIIHK